MNLGKDISQRRRQLGISQLDLAQLAQVGISTVKDIERGKANPSIATLEKICVVLGYEISLTLKRIEL
ncbi:MAG: helix-turn-helix domain-containing protein [Bacteroidales bacterium]|nr:helix-turn-helix domain-containing protein [Bacteroidales bacterium]